MDLITPSGTVFGWPEIDLLRGMAQHQMLAWTETPFTLKSGIESHVYFYGRNDLTDNPEFGAACGKYIGKKLSGILADDTRQPILIGVPTAGNGFAASVTHYDPRTFGRHRPGFRVMREKVKQHGAAGQKGFWVNGRPDTKRHAYATIENVVTSGESLDTALTNIESDGYPVWDMPHFVFMDREQGGVKKLRDKGYNLHVLFGLLDTSWAFMKLNISGWDAARVAAVEAEIKAHQVA
jgi:orotate phosphoribosyltransferase